MNLNKNLSVIEHIGLLTKKISNGILVNELDLYGLMVTDIYKHKDIYLKKISQHEFEKINYYFYKEIDCLILNPFTLKKMLKKENFIYCFKDNMFKNIFNDTFYIENKYIIKYSSNIEIKLDTLFLSKCLLNRKTINSFSFIIIIGSDIIYIMKRKDVYFLFFYKY